MAVTGIGITSMLREVEATLKGVIEAEAERQMEEAMKAFKKRVPQLVSQISVRLAHNFDNTTLTERVELHLMVHDK